LLGIEGIKKGFEILREKQALVFMWAW
jgi:hypothetical protein